jgi:hypothetical protein
VPGGERRAVERLGGGAGLLGAGEHVARVGELGQDEHVGAGRRARFERGGERCPGRRAVIHARRELAAGDPGHW